VRLTAIYGILKLIAISAKGGSVIAVKKAAPRGVLSTAFSALCRFMPSERIHFEQPFHMGRKGAGRRMLCQRTWR